MTPEELKDKFNQESPNLPLYQLRTLEVQVFHQRIHRLRWANLLGCLGALISFFALFIEQEPGGVHAFQSIERALYATPGLFTYYFLMLANMYADTLYWKAAFRWLVLVLSLILIVYELAFIAHNMSDLIHQAIWGWLPCHLFICFLAASNTGSLIGFKTPHASASHQG